MSITVNTEVDVNIFDVIDGLGNFSQSDLTELLDHVEYELSKGKVKTNEETVIKASTLEEEYKIGILKELFDKYSWSELEVIKKSIV